MKISDALFAAADLIEPPGKWVKGKLAAKTNGETVSAFSENAVCFCGMGALSKVTEKTLRTDYDSVLWQAINYFTKITRWRIQTFNDLNETTQEIMVAEMRRVAAFAVKEGI